MTQTIELPSAIDLDRDLITSLEYLSQSDSALGVAHDLPGLLKALTALPAGHVVHPLVYAWYREWVLTNITPYASSGLVAIGLDHVGAQWPLWHSIPENEFVIVSPKASDSPYTLEAWSALLNEGSDGRLVLAAPTDNEIKTFTLALNDALNLLALAAPAKALAWRRSIRMVVPVLNDPASEIRLGGGSSLFLPGVLVLNIAQASSPCELLASLVHEAAHVQLNSLCQHEPLALNAADECYRSPLRQDPRPMEGVLHAGYVCAVVADTMSDVANHSECGHLREEAMALAVSHVAPLSETLAIINTHAKLSAHGEWVAAAIRKSLAA